MPDIVTEALRNWWGASSPAMRGIAVMVISTVAFSTMHAAIVAVSNDLHPFQVAFFRNIFGLIVFLPVVFGSRLAVLHTERFALHAVRSLLNVVAMLAFFTALAMTPIARVTALGFTAPLFMALMSILVMGEKLVTVRWIALVAGFAGTMLIIRPGYVPLDVGSILVLASAFIWAITMIVIKMLSRTESSLTITAYMVVWLSIFSLIPALFVWRWPPLETWFVVAFIGCAGTVAQLLLAESLKQADATIVMPFDFLKLVWATAFGYVLFAQVPDPLVFAGAIVIFGAGCLVLWSERGGAQR